MHVGLNFEIEAGQTTVISGPNGQASRRWPSRSAACCPCLPDVLRRTPNSPLPSRRHPVRWRSKELLTRIGSVFQDPEHQFLTATVRDELSLGPRAIKVGAAEIATRTDELLERLHLAHLAAVNPYTLSGGEKRRLSVATMLATAPKVIILDEPTFGQDRRTWEELTRLLAEIADGGTAVIAATHDLDFAGLLADTRIVLPDWEPTADTAS